MCAVTLPLDCLQTGEVALTHARKFHPELLLHTAADCTVSIGSLTVEGLPEGFLMPVGQ